MEETRALRSKWFRKTAQTIITAARSSNTTAPNSTPLISIRTTSVVDLLKESSASSASSVAVLVVHLFCRASVKVVHQLTTVEIARSSSFLTKDSVKIQRRRRSLTSRRRSFEHPLSTRDQVALVLKY